MKSLGVCAALLLLILLPSSTCFGNNIVISGSAWSDNENDQHVSMLFGGPPLLQFQNQVNPLQPTTRNCVVGQECEILQSISAVFNVPGSSSSSFSYDFAFIELFFDMNTLAPVRSVTVGDPNADVLVTGTFTGLLELFDCGAGADCPFYGGVDLNSHCAGGTGSCPPVLLQTYSLSGVAAGDTDTWNPRANADFAFAGIAAPVPEPASLCMVGTGLIFVATRIRRKVGRR